MDSTRKLTEESTIKQKEYFFMHIFYTNARKFGFDIVGVHPFYYANVISI